LFKVQVGKIFCLGHFSGISPSLWKSPLFPNSVATLASIEHPKLPPPIALRSVLAQIGKILSGPILWSFSISFEASPISLEQGSAG
jgi:hypothetical protein